MPSAPMDELFDVSRTLKIDREVVWDIDVSVNEKLGFAYAAATYDRIELHAYPKLNIILGPNGTGKSTFLCAVVLGLGGKPNIIGRSPNVSDYIKRDRDHAVIELELFNNDGRNHVINRKILQNNSSQWYLQGKNVPFKTIEEVLEKYNILINNLCQILPQDRVQDFAKMDRKQLLENTQKAVGTGELFQWFQKLKCYRSELLNGGEDLNEIKKKFDVESQKLKNMEGDVLSYQEKQLILAKIGMMQKKEAWLLFDSKNDQRLKITNEVQEKGKAYEAWKKKLKPMVNAIKKQEAIEEQLTAKIQNKETIIQEINQKIKGLIRSAIQAKGSISTLKDDLDAKLKAHAEKNDNIELLQKKRDAFALQMPRVSESSLTTGVYVADKQIEKLNRELQGLRVREGEIENRKRKVHQAVKANEHRLAAASSVIDKKIELLQNVSKDSYEAFRWLRDNKHHFTGHIYGPMFLELNVASSNKAKYVERIVPRRDLIAFVCEDSGDMTKFLKILKDKKGLRVNAVCSSPQNECFDPKYPLNQMRQFGFTNYLIDLVEGPNPILHYLCKNYGLHNVPIGTETVDRTIDSVPTDLRIYFSSEQMYRTLSSRFSTNVTKTMEYVKEANLLAYSVNNDLINSIKDELEAKTQEMELINEEMATLNQKKQQLEVDNNQTKNNKREMSRQLEHLKSSKVRLRLFDEELEQLEQNSIDPEAEMAAASAKIKKYIEIMIHAESAILKLMKESSEARADLIVKKREVELVAWRVRDCQKESRQTELEAQHAKEAFDAKQEELSRIRAECKDLLNKAKAATDNLSTDDPGFTQKYKLEFQKYANTLEGLREEIAEQEAMARCLQDAGSSKVLEEYEERKQLLDQLGKALASKTSHRSTLQQQMMEMRAKWHPAMTNLLVTINSKFERCFQYLGCCGTVELDTTDDPDAIENYGLNIKVKFRNEGNLQALDPFTQSGGERSLSTAIFLLSLQSVINVPFRFVDEINQGMDAFNEVRVYYLIMCAVSQEKSAQYFLITPKLIEDTKVSLDTMSHVIYSGKCPKQEDPNQSSSSSKPTVWKKEKYFHAIGLSV